MEGLVDRLQAKLAGVSSRLKGKSPADDRSTSLRDTSTLLQSSRARLTLAEKREYQDSVEKVESEVSNRQPADILFSGARSIPETQRFGLQVLAEPDAGTAANVDIVFLHGLNGDPFRTWTAAGAEAPWPQVLLPVEVPRARIMTYGADFSYAHWLKPAGQNTVREHAMNLVTDLALKRYKTGTLDRPIIFVAYSLGGLVCENALVLSNSSPEREHRRVAEHTHGIVFLGTPHAGSDSTRFAKAISNILSCTIIKKPNKAILDILTRQSEVLASIQEDFQSLLELRQQNHQPPIAIHCCLEELPVIATGHRVVTPDSGAFPGYHTSSTIPANHMDLPKFREHPDIGFQRVSDFNALRTLAKDIEDLETRIHDRWRFQQMQPYRGSAIDWDWLYDSYEYKTWSSNTFNRVGNMLWLSDQYSVLTSLYLSKFVSTYSESHLSASSHDIVYFYCRAPPPELDVEFSSNSLHPPDSRGRLGSWPLAGVLCVFIAQILKSRGAYFESLSPLDHATLTFAFEATKVILQYGTNDNSSPENLQQALVTLKKSEDLLWSIFEGFVSAKRWRSLVIVLDGLSYAKLGKAYRFLARLSKLQEIVSKVEGSLRSVVSSVYHLELQRVLGKAFPGLLRLDRSAEMADCLISFRPHASNRRRHNIDTTKVSTGAWLFNSETYKMWKKSDRSCMLSIQGKPGSGKSTLMKHILDSMVKENDLWYDDEGIFLMTRSQHRERHMQIPPAHRSFLKPDPGSLRSEVTGEGKQREAGTEGRTNYSNVLIVASYFFHARGREISHSDMLQSLIYQMVSQNSRLYSACERRYRRLREQCLDRKAVFEWEFEDLKLVFLEIVRCQILSEGLSVPIRHLFFIDALDESDDKVEQIVNLFRYELDESPHIIKTVLASRPIRVFDGSQSAPGSFHTILEGHNEGDIGIYTDSEMSFLLHDTDNPDHESRASLFLSITEYIKKNARGVFLWVVLICRALKHYTRNGYSPGGLQKELASLPKDLEGFYQMMTQRLDRNLEPRDLQEARKILNWIIFAERPLTMAEMRDIIAIPFGDGIHSSPSPSFLEDHRIVGLRGVKQKMRHTCGHLLEIVKYNPGSTDIDERDAIQLIHETVREFLLHDKEIAKPFNTNSDLGTQAIITVCTQYLEVCFRSELSSPLKSRRIPSLIELSTIEADECQQFAKSLVSLPLLWYMIEHLFRHLRTSMLRQSSGNSCDAILGCFKGWNNFGQQHVLFLLGPWIRRGLLELRGDVDLSFLDSVMPEDIVGFQSGCLSAAAKQNNLKLVANLYELLDARLDFGVANELLLDAARSGDVRLVANLLQAGADGLCRDDKGCTPLHHAARNGHEAVIEELLALRYLKVNSRTYTARPEFIPGTYTKTTDKFTRTALHVAAQAGHEAKVRRLLTNGAPVNARDGVGDTTLHYAALLGNGAIVERLLSFKADVKIKNQKEQTAQDVATENGHHRVADALQTSNS